MIDGRDITGQVVVNAPNVTIRNTRIRSNTMWVIDNNSTGLVVEDSESAICRCPASGTAITRSAAATSRFDARRSRVARTADGDPAGNITVTDNWIHNLDKYGPSYVWGNSPHTDGIQISQSTNIVIRHNTIDPVPESGAGATSAIIMAPSTGTPNTNTWIEDNYSTAAIPRTPSTRSASRRKTCTSTATGFSAASTGTQLASGSGITVTQFNENRDAYEALIAPVSPDDGG